MDDAIAYLNDPLPGDRFPLQFVNKWRINSTKAVLCASARLAVGADDLESYLELLAIVIAAKFGGAPKTIWCMDLRNVQDFARRSSA
jgi:hypothetical protein